jgi:predicted O-methyltransferase YrrM
MLQRFRAWRGRRRQIERERSELASLPTAAVDATRLRAIKRREVEQLLSSPAIGVEWPAVAATIDALVTIEDMKTGGVNPGDRRALYHLIRAFRPRRVLEIGTNVGASTIHIAAAMKRNNAASKNECALVTVDIEDVNDPANGYWKRAGLSRSPRDTIASMGMAGCVTFVTRDSIAYFDENDARFDLIFVDGDHAATAVYREIPRVLDHLCEQGVVVLHDVFPRHRPLWSNRVVEPGPLLALQRLQSEGARIDVIPLGALPWPTKLGTNVTSLALLTGV